VFVLLYSEHIIGFEKYLTEERRSSKNTVTSYSCDLEQFSEYLDKRGIDDFGDVTCAVATEYMDKLRKSGRSSSSVSRMFATLKCFYDYLASVGKSDVSPLVGITMARPTTKLPEILTSGEVTRMLAQPNLSDRKGIRDKAMLALLYATGIRVSELLSLDVSDVDIDAGTLKCIGRGKPRVIGVDGSAMRAVAEYIAKSRGELLADPNECALFVNMGGERMSRQGFWKLIKHYARCAGIEKDISPHTIRHSFAAHRLESGADIHDLKEMLGHADLSSTQMYSRLVSRQAKR
jgi:integrase/recombinase XerD